MNIKICNCEELRKSWDRCEKHGDCPCFGKELFTLLDEDYSDVTRGYYANYSFDGKPIANPAKEKRELDYLIKRKLLVSLLHQELDKKLPGVYKIV